MVIRIRFRPVRPVLQQLVSRHVIVNQEIGFKKFGIELRRMVGLHQILTANVIRTTTKLSMPFQVLGL